MLLLIGVLAVVSLICWFIAIKQGRAVLYHGVGDFLWSMCVQLTPVYTGLLLLWLRPEGSPLAIDRLLETWPQYGAASLSLAVFLLALIKSLRFAMRANGSLPGMCLFLPKTIAGLIVVWFCGGVMSLLLGKKRTGKRTLISLLIFGFGGVLVEALITPVEKQAA
ncbi:MULTISPECIES: hypothetical protein [unclassified Pseudovibrio]|uniref:hypothetical protein n=1 Tax=unclassified Pseudovibrio TaxID=2627060 RepID=UPI0007095FAA|nr:MULTISPECIES: hypothetical protein [unclassified Pseudovibrio]KZL18657.1 hypothetical protein PsAD37_03834 [Pseudovibrio sp. Ad37]